MTEKATPEEVADVILGEDEESAMVTAASILQARSQAYSRGRTHGFLWGIGATVGVYLIFKRWA